MLKRPSYFESYKQSGKLWENVGIFTLVLFVDMTNLIGEFECKVDAKGRLLIPAGLRKQFSAEAEGRLFVKRGIESCLELYQKHDWERVSKQVSGLNQFVKKNRLFARKFISGVMQLDVDNVGRILLPKPLLSYAGVDKEMVLFAYGDKIEIWSKANYEAELNMQSDEFSDLAEDVMGSVNPGSDELS